MRPTDPRAADTTIARRHRVVIGLVCLTFATAFVYRFNALLGSLGGFDGDHFMYYLGAQHVMLGERPLRDFADAGLQGAWPALTYELPALAQRLGGATLLSEAVLCVGAVALSTALLFRASASLSGIVPSLAVTLVSLGTGTRLYGYSKVLVSAGAVTLLLRYARAPSTVNAGWLGVWSAVAFLFRHDYLAYVGSAAVVLIFALPGLDASAKFRRVLTYAGSAALLLAAPLYSVRHFVGLVEYARTNLELTRRESARTDLEWPVFEGTSGGILPFFDSEVNATAWLYYLCLAIPLLAVGATLTRPRLLGLDVGRSRAVLLSLASYAFLLDLFLLRGNLAARFGDLGPPIAVLAAWLGGAGWVQRRAAVAGVRVSAMIVLATCVLAVNTTGGVWQELFTTRLRVGLRDVVGRTGEVIQGLRTMPPPAEASVEERRRTNRADPDLIAYLRACTSSSDRLLVLADAAEVTVFAGRLFAGGQPTFRAGFHALEEEEVLTLSRLERQPVPVVLTRDQQDFDQHIEPDFRTIAAYVAERYVYTGELPALTGGPMRVLVRKDLLGSEPFAGTGIPCPH
jgi:hypothetical protein